MCTWARACLLPLLWASSCDAELTATLHSEQYSSRRAFSSSVSVSVGSFGSWPGPDGGSGGLSSSASPVEGSEGAADVALWARGEATGAGVDEVIGDADGRDSLSMSESVKGVGPGDDSAGTEQPSLRAL